jgi:hypothetical protein
VFSGKRLQKLNWILIAIEFSQCFSKFSQCFLNWVLVSLHHLVFLYLYSNAAMDSSSSEQSESDCSSGSPRRLKGKQKDKEYEPTDDDEAESDSDESLHNSDSKEESPHSGPVLPSNIEIDDEELALQQVCLCQVDTFLFGGFIF